MQFNVEEENLICLYHNADRRRTLAKLDSMTDADFEARKFHFTDE